MGYTPNLAVGAWVGNDNEAMGGGLSGLITTPMWRAFMDVAHPTIEDQRFPEPPPTDPTLNQSYVVKHWITAPTDQPRTRPVVALTTVKKQALRLYWWLSLYPALCR